MTSAPHLRRVECGDPLQQPDARVGRIESPGLLHLHAGAHPQVHRRFVVDDPHPEHDSQKCMGFGDRLVVDRPLQVCFRLLQHLERQPGVVTESAHCHPVERVAQVVVDECVFGKGGDGPPGEEHDVGEGGVTPRDGRSVDFASHAVGRRVGAILCRKAAGRYEGDRGQCRSEPAKGRRSKSCHENVSAGHVGLLDSGSERKGGRYPEVEGAGERSVEGNALGVVFAVAVVPDVRRIQHVHHGDEEYGEVAGLEAP